MSGHPYVLPSFHPSVRPSIRPSVHPSICPSIKEKNPKNNIGDQNVMKSKIIEIAYTCGFTTTQEITQALLKTSVETTKYEKHPFYNLIYIYIYIYLLT